MTRIQNCQSIFVALIIFTGCEADEPEQQSTEPVIEEAAEVADVTEVPVAEEAEPTEEVPVNPSTGELLPMPFSAIWTPWKGDYEGMIERRVIRVLVPYGGYQFYYEDGQPKGAVYELVQRFETYINEQLDRRNIKVYVVVIPVSRDELLPALLKGHADFVAADLTPTEARSNEFNFSRPLLTGINEVIVTGPAAPEIATLDDLAGLEITVRPSSSYFEHLQRLGATMEEAGAEAPRIKRADELLEAEDLLEVVNAGMIGMTVLDDYKARFWAGVFPEITVREDLVINEGGSIAWATRKDTPELSNVINQFLRKYGKGSMIGNDTFNRYLKDAARVRCAHVPGITPRGLEALARRIRDVWRAIRFRLADARGTGIPGIGIAAGPSQSRRRDWSHANQAINGCGSQRRH